VSFEGNIWKLYSLVFNLSRRIAFIHFSTSPKGYLCSFVTSFERTHLFSLQPFAKSYLGSSYIFTYTYMRVSIFWMNGHEMICDSFF